MISAVGRDSLGDEILQVARDKNVNVDFVGRVRVGLPTGTVIATLDEKGNATYELVQPAAWDEIKVPAKALTAIAKARALTFGSTRGPLPLQRGTTGSVACGQWSVEVFRCESAAAIRRSAPLVFDLAKRADILKLNDGELGKLASWIRTGELVANTPSNPDQIAQACATIADATDTARICVTLAEEGAALWDQGNLVTARAPKSPLRTLSAQVTHLWPV